MNSKYEMIAERIAQRIDRGDYSQGLLPSERDLADSLGICQNTARKALQKLIEKGRVSRLPNGRLELGVGRSLMQIALLAPAWNTPEVDDWYIAMQRLAGEYHFCIKVVYYLHDDDPVIPETPRQYDGTFLLPPCLTESGRARMIAGLRKTGKPFFTLNEDWSACEVPSLLAYSPHYVNTMIEHLVCLGHRRIDCINVQPGTVAMPQRIAVWRQALTERGLDGELHNEPVEFYQDALPQAYRLADKLLRQGRLREGALLCLTEPCACGVLRALADHGLSPGADIAVATADASKRAEYAIPTLTSMSVEDPAECLECCFNWLRHKERTNWEGPLRMTPGESRVVVRQSTVPDADRLQSPLRRQDAGA